MPTLIRIAGLFTALMLMHAGASAATPKEIEAAKKKGADWIQAKYAKGASGEIGHTCLCGLALLEYGIPGTDPAVKAITESVRNAAYTQNKTYQISLCLMYLDRYGEPADVPLIQALAARLLVGQNLNGGWGYDCIPAVAPADVQLLRGLKPGEPGKLHPEVEKYAQKLPTVRAGKDPIIPDDNSNTQFAVIAVWLSRKHGVPTDAAFTMIENRFRAAQNPQTGGWGYAYSVVGNFTPGEGTPSMYCAGLIGLATGIARREERRTKPEPKPEPKKSEPVVDPKKNPDDPFFNPVTKTPAEPKVEPKKNPPRLADALDRASLMAFTGLGIHLAESARAGNGALLLKTDSVHGRNDLYFLWSLERVGVIYGVEKIGGVNWYEAGAHSLVHTQSPDGSWGRTDYGADVNTAFAVLFLCKSNLARDLSGKVQKEHSTEMKAGNPTGTDPKTTENPGGITKKDPLEPPVFVPGPVGSEVATLAAELVRSGDQDWAKSLAKLRDAKGAVHTQALATAVYKLDGEKRKEVREALAERLTRMNADTLRAMAKVEDPELRRAAVLAMAMKDDKAHIPDLVAALTDDEDFVVRAARAGLRSLTGEDFGPAPNASAGEKTLAATSWRQWMSKQKK
ncbi:MAG: hypothetical protein C0467_28200 [Planctomycetaceae bacterium]|nr:hypothetical protein [Planctomycetaceae bacterium]